MPGPLATGNNTEDRVPGGLRVVRIPFRGTTAANGDLTLTYNYNGTLTQSRATNNYTFVVGPFKQLLSAVVNSGTATAFSGTVGATDGSAGTVRIDFAATLVSTQMIGELVFEVTA